jgi:hypothetical protein
MESAVATTPAVMHAEGVIAAALRTATATAARDARAAYEASARSTMESLARELRARDVGSAGLTIHDFIGQTVAGILATASREARLAMASAAREAVLESRRTLEEGLSAQLLRASMAGFAPSRAAERTETSPHEETAVALDWDELYGQSLRDLRAQLHAQNAQVQGPARWQIVLLIAVCQAVAAIPGVSEETKIAAHFVSVVAYLMLARDYARPRGS